jgi:hypothetical protein
VDDLFQFTGANILFQHPCIVHETHGAGTGIAVMTFNTFDLISCLIRNGFEAPRYIHPSAFQMAIIILIIGHYISRPLKKKYQTTEASEKKYKKNIYILEVQSVKNVGASFSVLLKHSPPQHQTIIPSVDSVESLESVI